jgi:hypothetical protein
MAGRAARLHTRALEVLDLPGKGCIFSVVLPVALDSDEPAAGSAYQESPEARW